MSALMRELLRYFADAFALHPSSEGGYLDDSEWEDWETEVV